MADQLAELDIDERFRARLQGSTAAVVALDEEGCVTAWSQGAVRIFGWTREEVVGRRLPILGPGQEEDFRARMEELRQGRPVRILRRTHLRKDGSSVDVVLSVHPLTGTSGRFRGVLALAAPDGSGSEPASSEEAERVRALERQLADLELRTLQDGLPAPFLLNGLHVMSVLLRQGRQDEAVQALSRLGRLLRHVVAAGRRTLVPLREELGFLEDYARVEALRLDGELAYEARAAAEVRDARMPSLLLLPLVENAVRHGVAPRGGGRVAVHAEVRDGQLWLEVRDDGPGMSELPPVADGAGGLGAVRQRIDRLYGETAALELESAEDGGAVVRLRLPMARVDEEER